MFIFFLVIVAAIIVNTKVKNKYKEIWPGISPKDLNGLISCPLGYVILCYIYAYITKLGITVSDNISSLFDVDTYIGFLGNGWLGLIAQWLRSEGIIGDIVTPAAIAQYNEVLSIITPFATVIGVGAIGIGILYLTQLKKHNVTILYWCYYSLVACVIVSSVVLLIGITEFASLIRAVINDFNLTGTFIFIITITIACVYRCTSCFRIGIHSLSNCFSLDKCAKERHIMWISLCASTIVSIILILLIVTQNNQTLSAYEPAVCDQISQQAK